MLVPLIGDGRHCTTHTGEDMRHRDESGAAKGVVGGVTDTISKVTDLLHEDETGKHKVPAAQPLVPIQAPPTHEALDTSTVESPNQTTAEYAIEDLGQQQPASSELPPATPLPTSLQWKAGHGLRFFAAALLLFAVAGTSALGLRYAETHGTDEFISVVVGVGVVVALWALLIASTPQVVSLRGSILTVRNSSGSERFDLADGLQPVDVVGEPRSSSWAVLLHRSNNTSVVLRRRDVDAAALDPIVRHYRALANQRYSDRQVRFSR
jgi:hypothetical protein